MSLSARIAAVRQRIDRAAEAAGRDPGSVDLLAVSKVHPPDLVREAHALGLREFGENRIQELDEKARATTDLPGLHWHQIGPVQSNKVRLLCGVPGLEMLHTVDRPKLVDRLVDAIGDLRPDGPLRVLIQIDATDDDTKHGVRPEHAEELARVIEAAGGLLVLDGVMAMGPRESDPGPVFEEVARCRAALQQRLGRSLPVFSLGMSGDIEQAVAAGSTMVRVGTDVFGPRPQRV